MKTTVGVMGALLMLGGLLSGVPASADMNKTEPALPAAAGSKAEAAINEGMGPARIEARMRRTTTCGAF